MSIIRIHIILVILLSFTIVCKSQPPMYLFKNINKSQGLSHNWIKTILKDSSGFYWFGTLDGLNKFDGYTFTNYKNIAEDTTSISENIISLLFEDPSGLIWVQAGDHFDKYDPVKDIFIHDRKIFNNQLTISQGTRAIALYDTCKNVWFASQYGLYKYQPNNKKLTKIPVDPKDPNSLSSDSIFSLQVDSHNQIWVITYDATLEQIDNNTNKLLKKIKLPKPKNNSFFCTIDSQDDIWIYQGSFTKGIFCYSIKKDSLNFFDFETGPIKPKSKIITKIIEDYNNNIWIGTDQGGITIYNKSTKHTQLVEHSTLNNKSLCGNVISYLYKDDDGFIWIGTYKNGLSYYHPYLQKFNHVQIPAKGEEDRATINDIDNFFEDESGNLWIGTNGAGVIIYNPNNKSYKQLKHDPSDPNSLSANIIIGMLRDSKNRLWIGTYLGGLNCLQNGKNTLFKSDKPEGQKLTDDKVWDICEDSDGDIWVATLLGGVNVIDGKTLKIKQVFRGWGTSTINSNVIFDIYADKEGRLWFATANGLKCYNKQTNIWKEYLHKDDDKESISKNLVYSTIQDRRGWIWVATGDGLNLLNNNTGKFRIFREKDGLSSNYIITLVEDDNGNIWMSTSNGLSNLIITPDSLGYNFTFYNYDENDGLQGYVFNEKSAYKTKNGKLIFGGSNGFNIFYPEQVKTRNFHAPTIITDIQLFNVSINDDKELAKKLNIDSSAPYISQLTIEYFQKVITIEFANLNYLFPEKRNYRYILEGFNDEWLTTKADARRITYTNLDPGNYTFKVYSDTNDGSWDKESIAQLDITVLSPWWQTILFKVSVLCIFISIIFLTYRYRTYKIIRQKKILSNLVHKRTLQLEEANIILEGKQEEIYTQNEELQMQKKTWKRLIKNL